ncbi:hypothetical protein LH935_06785 [Gordonia polyisoprenivorans]|uniref:hypothetical protein n=1 Tax=Gordonia polyisoprenivorans TaxID=84595 RepID=UPI0022347268|nr:hypothetical protein LH935_06785 [Gordonia polyisoprenivorans]
MSANLHEVTVTEVDEDGDVTEWRITHCPKTDFCAVWHECKECESPLTKDLDDEEYDRIYDELSDEGIVRHGLLHNVLDGGWFSRDDPHNCGAQWADDWGWPDGLTVGTVCTFDVDYADGEWWPIGIEITEKS